MTDLHGRVTRACRGMVAAVVAAATAIGVGNVVRADDVSNNIDATVDAVAEVLALNVGGAEGVTSLSITPRAGDGKNGCNLTGSSTLTVSVTSSNTTVATVSPGSVTFSSCGDVKALTVTPVGTGSTTVLLAQLSNTTGGTFNLAPATFIVNVAPPANAAPTVNVTGVTSGASYEFGAVPVAGCSVNDAEDGAMSFAASLSSVSGPLSGFGLGVQEASCSYTDEGGLTASSSVTYSIVDSGKPLITPQSRTAANSNGWNRTDVTVTWSCSDPVSGVVADTVTATVNDEGAGQSATGTCTDGAGNSTSATETNIDIDKTAPITTFLSRLPAPNADGWNNSAVVVTWSCADAGGSGVLSPTVSDTIDAEGVDQEATGTCEDLADNTSTGSVGDIDVDTTPPSITRTSRTPSNINGWNDTAVTIEWTCADAGAGVRASMVTETISTEGAQQSATGVCTDLAGNTASATETGINIDMTAPTIEFDSRSPVANAADWHNAPVTVTWSCSDDLAGVEHPSVSETVSTEGHNQSATGLCADLAGNTASATETGINIDLTAPTVEFESRSPVANAAGWNNSPVTVVWSCSDDLAGVEHPSVSQTVSTEGQHQSATGVCMDLAGNTASATATGINIDTTAPTIAWTGGPTAGSTHIFGSVPPAPTCSASDALSGVSGGCHVTGYVTSVGTHTMTAMATDVAGNRQEQTRTYTVQPWTLRGFYQPVDMNGVWNTVKGGSTVPLKFEVFAGTTELTDPSIAGFVVTSVACTTGTGSDEIEFTTTGGTSLRYDSTGGQFIQNWQTPKQVGSCYRVTLKTADGSTLTALFRLK